MTAVALPTSYRLDTGDIAAIPVRLNPAPHMSVLSWLLDLAQRRSANDPIFGAVDAVLSPEGRRVLPALGTPGLDRIPDVLTEFDDTAARSPAAYADRLADTDGSRLTAEISALWNGRPPEPWRAAAERPRPWLRAAGRAILDTWSVGRPRWRAADFALRREEARVGAAVVTGHLDVLVETLHPRLHVCGNLIEFEGNCDRTISRGSRSLVLIPLLVPGRRVIVDFESSASAVIAYSLPGLTIPTTGVPAESAAVDRLSALLGPLRAAVLKAVDRPISMQALATSVHCSPSTLTYHCDQLASTGLLHRERQGRSIRVSRSERGSALVDLLA